MSRPSRSQLLATLLAGASALVAPAALGLVVGLGPSAALAQDYTSGTFRGRVVDASGAPIVGAKAVVRSQGTGVSQTSITDSTGTFRAPLVPSGAYSVVITKAGLANVEQSGLTVATGGESSYEFTMVAATSSAEVIVTASRARPQLDFTQTTKGLSVDVENLQKTVPIARNVTSVTLLAPGVVAAAPGFTTTDGTPVSAIGGGSAGETQFYLNGLNITNFDTYIGGATVPFDFYKTIEVKTGGYPAEFGRATGGVINAVTKSGTNDLYFAVHGDYQPDWARSLSPNTFSSDNARRTSDNYQTTLEAGGPLLKDHLFAYGLYQFNDIASDSASNTAGTFSHQHSTSPFYGYKIDAYITSKQHLEFTDFNTSRVTLQDNYLFTAPDNNFTSSRDGQAYINGGYAPGAIGSKLASTRLKSGGNNYVARYTGTFTDWFTLSAAYGRNRDENYVVPSDTTASYTQDARANGTSFRLGPVPSANSSTSIDNTEREFYRFDGDLYFNLLGRHHARIGYDHEATDLFHSSFRSGGAIYTYQRVRSAATAANLNLPLNQEYVRVEVAQFGDADVTGANEAFYAQDSWDITRRLNVQLGIRDDNFELNNLTGQRALNLTDNLAARAAVSYDPIGAGTDKISLSYGRYYIPPASNLSFRGRDLYYRAYYLPPTGSTYTPYIDPSSGKPTALGTLLTALNNSSFATAQGLSACPAAVTAATPGTSGRIPGCTVFGDGTQEPAISKAAVGFQASYEDEIILSYSKKLTRLWSVGAAFTWRNLGEASEDAAIDAAVGKFCARNPSINGCSDPNLSTVLGGDSDYVVLNPGKTTKVRVRADLDTPLAGQVITLTKDDLANPPAKREYLALELTAARAFDGNWGINFNYTLSSLRGNYEGTVKSDAGDGVQTDAGSTEDFDHPGLTEYSSGFLPNHRQHQIKIYGSYQLLPGLLVGGNLLVTSPRKYGCIGDYGGTADPIAAEYDPGSHYCINPATGESEPAPRGRSFEGDWYTQFDMQAAYTLPKIGHLPGNLVVRADVFNLFNTKQVVQNSETGDDGSGGAVGTYTLPISYQTPRYARLGFDLTF